METAAEDNKAEKRYLTIVYYHLCVPDFTRALKLMGMFMIKKWVPKNEIWKF